MDPGNPEAWMAATIAAAAAKESADVIFYISMATALILIGGVVIGIIMLSKIHELEQLIKLGLIEGEITIKPLEIKIEKKGGAK